MKNTLKLFALLVLFASCEKEIDLKLDDRSGQLVIEGNITDQPGPYYVQLTRSVPFTQTNVYPAVADATVTISDQTGKTNVLVYAGNGRYKTSGLNAIVGNTYTLNVTVDGKTYTANSKLPPAVALDELLQDSIKFAGEVRYAVRPIYTDPPLPGNNYRFIISVNGKSNKAYNLISDNIDNGKVNQRAFPIINDSDLEEVKKGDLITVEMQCLDQPIYTYYNALAEINGRGGVTPANPPSNISGGALGRFSAHTVAKKNMVLK